VGVPPGTGLALCVRAVFRRARPWINGDSYPGDHSPEYEDRFATELQARGSGFLHGRSPAAQRQQDQCL